MAQLIKWRVSPPPVGQYRSFSKRAWPMGWYTAGDRPAVQILCPDGYSPRVAKTGLHRMLTLMVADYTKGTAFEWVRIGPPMYRLDEAKAAALAYLEANTQIQPKEDTL